MQTYRLHGREDLRLEQQAAPPLEPGQALIRVRRAGICGSDVHYYEHGYIGSFVPKRPFTLGHEFAGEVVDVGAEVEAVSPGQAVAIDPSMPCGACELCRLGRYNLCYNMKFPGSASCDPHIDGGFAEYVVMPAANCLAMSEGLSFAEAAMIEPLSVAMHGVMQAGTVAGRSVLITGGGAIGQLVLRVARAFGARHITVMDLDPFAREFALESGADEVLNPDEPGMFDQAGPFEIVIEAAGATAALSSAIRLARRGGTIVQVGTLPAEVPIPANLIMARELAVVGSFRFAHVFPTAMQMAASKRIDVRPLISATYAFADLPEAMERAVAKQQVIKVQVEI
jgi:L-idonate 5-dehydrogenase